MLRNATQPIYKVQRHLCKRIIWGVFKSELMISFHINLNKSIIKQAGNINKTNIYSKFAWQLFLRALNPPHKCRLQYKGEKRGRQFLYPSGLKRKKIILQVWMQKKRDKTKCGKPNICYQMIRLSCVYCWRDFCKQISPSSNFRIAFPFSFILSRMSWVWISEKLFLLKLLV